MAKPDFMPFTGPRQGLIIAAANTAFGWGHPVGTRVQTGACFKASANARRLLFGAEAGCSPVVGCDRPAA